MARPLPTTRNRPRHQIAYGALASARLGEWPAYSAAQLRAALGKAHGWRRGAVLKPATDGGNVGTILLSGFGALENGSLQLPRRPARRAALAAAALVDGGGPLARRAAPRRERAGGAMGAELHAPGNAAAGPLRLRAGRVQARRAEAAARPLVRRPRHWVHPRGQSARRLWAPLLHHRRAGARRFQRVALRHRERHRRRRLRRERRRHRRGEGCRERRARPPPPLWALGLDQNTRLATSTSPLLRAQARLHSPASTLRASCSRSCRRSPSWPKGSPRCTWPTGSVSTVFVGHPRLGMRVNEVTYPSHVRDACALRHWLRQYRTLRLRPTSGRDILARLQRILGVDNATFMLGASG